MKKRGWLLLLFLIVGHWVMQAQEKEDSLQIFRERQTEDSLMQVLGSIPAFTIYKDNYVVTGTSFKGGGITKYNSDAKFQISLRHRLFRKLLPYRIYVFLTYTQKSFWDIYRKSAPFAENNYNPSIGFGRNFIRNKRIEAIGLIQFEHESNGRDSIFSRSWNRLTFTGIFIPDRNISFQAKAWIAMNVADENKHLTRYAGIGHFAGTYTSNDGRFSSSVLMIKRGGWNWNANWRVDVAYRLFKADNQYLYFQFYNGYGESMIRYNELRHFVRLGFVIKPNSVSIF